MITPIYWNFQQATSPVFKGSVTLTQAVTHFNDNTPWQKLIQTLLASVQWLMNCNHALELHTRRQFEVQSSYIR